MQEQDQPQTAGSQMPVLRPSAAPSRPEPGPNSQDNSSPSSTSQPKPLSRSRPAYNEIFTLWEISPSGPRSLSYISLASFFLGFVVSSGTILSVLSVLSLSRSRDLSSSPQVLKPPPAPTPTLTSLLESGLVPPSVWKISTFIVLLAIFHFLEFWTHAYRNVPNARVAAFLFSNGHRYTTAYILAIAEALLRTVVFKNGTTTTFFNSDNWFPARATILPGCALVLVGQTIRSAAIIHAGTNFNHVIQAYKKDDHRLVTTGVYAFFRHPSYFGFFWWAIGTQLVMGNPVCLIAYALVLVHFFKVRVREEERQLLVFFGDAYRRYRDRTWVGIPFVG